MTKTLIFAGNAPAAYRTANEHGLAWSDVIYVHSTRVLLGMQTRGMPRIFGHGIGSRSDWLELETMLIRQDQLG